MPAIKQGSAAILADDFRRHRRSRGAIRHASVPRSGAPVVFALSTRGELEPAAQGILRRREARPGGPQ
jgi:hypothetical protein